MPAKYIGWCLIPPHVLAADDLNNSQKLLLGRIYGLVSKHGYFYGSNKYLGEQIGLSAGAVSNYISDISKKGYISVKISTHDGGTDRRIYLNNMEGGTSIHVGGGTSIHGQSNRDKSNRVKEKIYKKEKPVFVETWNPEYEGWGVQALKRGQA